VVANRELGDSFASSEPVTFTYFDLKKNTEGDPGEPLYYFKKSKVTKAKANYCDAGDAFRHELGLEK